MKFVGQDIEHSAKCKHGKPSLDCMVCPTMRSAQIPRTSDATNIARKMIARARGRKWLHIGLMLLWAVLALATTAWCLIGVLVHWAFASFHEQLDPHLARRIREERARWFQQLRDEEASHHVIENMKRELWYRQNPWARYAIAAMVSPFIIWARLKDRL